MIVSRRLRARMIGVSATALVVVLATAGVAMAANQVKGANYSGTINANGGGATRLKGSTHGKDRVKMKKAQPPLFCSGGGPPPPPQPPTPAPVSRAGGLA